MSFYPSPQYFLEKDGMGANAVGMKMLTVGHMTRRLLVLWYAV